MEVIRAMNPLLDTYWLFNFAKLADNNQGYQTDAIVSSTHTVVALSLVRVVDGGYGRHPCQIIRHLSIPYLSDDRFQKLKKVEQNGFLH